MFRNVKVTSTRTFNYECEQPPHPASHRRYSVGTRGDDQAGGSRAFAESPWSETSTKSPITIRSSIQESTSHLRGNRQGGNCGGDNCTSHDLRNRQEFDTRRGRPNAHATSQCNDTRATQGSGEVRWVRAHQIDAERGATLPPLPSTVRFIGSSLSLHLEGE